VSTFYPEQTRNNAEKVGLLHSNTTHVLLNYADVTTVLETTSPRVHKLTLKYLHWLKSTNALNINLFLLPSLQSSYNQSSTYSYLNNLISVQPPRSTRSSSVVTLSRPPTISSLRITDRSFRYTSPRLWNQLPDSFRQPRQSCLDSPSHSLVSLSLLSSTLSSSITPSLFHSRLKTYLFNKSFPPWTSFTYRTAFMTTGLDRIYHAHRFIFSFTF